MSNDTPPDLAAELAALRDEMAELRRARGRQPSRRRRIAVLAALGVSAAWLVAGAVWASIPDAQGSIHACYKLNGGGLRVIDTGAGQHCVAGERAISWDTSFAFRGEWKPAVSYRANDVVTRNGSSYVPRPEIV